MKITKQISIGLITAFLLAGCSLFSKDDWVTEYGSPVLFLNGEARKGCGIYLNDQRSELMEDENDEIKNAILESGPFAKCDEHKTVVEKSFTYQKYYYIATTGPSCCYMSIYEDGYIVIAHQKTLFKPQYRYYIMDSDKASILCDLVFSKETIETTDRLFFDFE